MASLSFQSMAEVRVAERDRKLNILSSKKGSTRVGAGRPTDGGESIWG